MLFLCSIERGRSSVPTAFRQKPSRAAEVKAGPIAVAPSAQLGFDRSEHGGIRTASR
jgi:hypothetical protein